MSVIGNPILLSSFMNRLYLVRNGLLQSGFNLAGTITQESGYVEANGSSGGTAYWCSIGPVADIDYKYLVVVMSDEYLSGTTTSNGTCWGIAHTATYSSGSWPKQVATGSYRNQAVTLRMDVTSVSFSTARYVAFRLLYANRYMKITDLYFTNEEPS